MHSYEKWKMIGTFAEPEHCRKNGEHKIRHYLTPFKINVLGFGCAQMKLLFDILQALENALNDSYINKSA